MNTSALSIADRPIPPLQAPPTRQSIENTDDLKRVAADFESLFFGMLLKQMRQSVKKSEVFHGGRGEEIFQSLLDQEIAKKSAHSQPLGIARILYERYADHVRASEQMSSSNFPGSAGASRNHPAPERVEPMGDPS